MLTTLPFSYSFVSSPKYQTFPSSSWAYQSKVFSLVLVGSFDLDTVRPLARRFLGALPARRRDDAPRDPGITTPAGVVEREVHQGVEPQSQTAIVFSGALRWTPADRWALQGLAEALEVRLRNELREELGATYGVGVSAELNRLPRPEYRIRITYGSAPERAAELATAVLATVKEFRARGPTAVEVANWKATVARQQEVALKENETWATLLAAADAGGEDPATQLDVHRWIDPLTPERLRDAAAQYLVLTRYVRVTLLPAVAVRPGK